MSEVKRYYHAHHGMVPGDGCGRTHYDQSSLWVLAADHHRIATEQTKRIDEYEKLAKEWEQFGAKMMADRGRLRGRIEELEHEIGQYEWLLELAKKRIAEMKVALTKISIGYGTDEMRICAINALAGDTALTVTDRQRVETSVDESIKEGSDE